MNVKQISYGVIGSLILSYGLTSCSDNRYRNKAKQDAIEYLSGADLIKAEKYAKEQYPDDIMPSNAVAYWDSLLIEAKAKEAYLKGVQMVKDSAAGKPFRKEEFTQKLDTVVPLGFLNETIESYSKYTTAKEFIDKRNNSPAKEGLENEFPYETHYWNLITMTAKQQEAFNKGAADARKELLK